MGISVVIPLFNKKESPPELYAWIECVMQQNAYSYEAIFVDDGSTDDSRNVIQHLASQSEHVRGTCFRRNHGKSPALYCRFKGAQDSVATTTDVNLRDSPDEIPELYRMITVNGHDLVPSYKRKCYDLLSRTLPVKLFSAAARKISGIRNLHDFDYELKAYRREAMKNTEVYGEMHHYISYLAKSVGSDKVGERVVHHQARKYGTSKFGFNRLFNGYFDLTTLWFLSSLGEKPMHVFDFLGSLMFLVGSIAVIVLGAKKAYALSDDIPMRLIIDSPYSFIALTTVLIDTQLFLASLLDDLISRSNPDRNDYQIEETMRCER